MKHDLQAITVMGFFRTGIYTLYQDSLINTEVKMNRQITYIVGSYFDEFAKMPNVMTCTEFLESIQKDELPAPARFVIGQGISPDRISEILSSAETKKLGHLIHKDDFSQAEQKLTHKRVKKNTMITSPVKVSEALYRASLRLDSPAELQDHLTGKHIPGMSLNEAARQMFIAVSEKFFAMDENDSRNEYYFVINDFKSEYLRFVFPTSVLISYRIKSHKKRKNGSLAFEVETVFFQAMGKCVYRSDIKFSMYDYRYLNPIETRIAHENLYTEPVSRTMNPEYAEFCFS